MPATAKRPVSKTTPNPLAFHDLTPDEITTMIVDAVESDEIDARVAKASVCRWQGLTPAAVERYRRLLTKAKAAAEEAGTAADREAAKAERESAETEGGYRIGEIRAEIESLETQIEEIELDITTKRRRAEGMAEAVQELKTGLTPPLIKTRDDEVAAFVRKKHQQPWQDAKQRIDCLQGIIDLDVDSSNGNLRAFVETRLRQYYGNDWKTVCPFVTTTTADRLIQTRIDPAGFRDLQRRAKQELPEAQQALKEIEDVIAAEITMRTGSSYWITRFGLG